MTSARGWPDRATRRLWVKRGKRSGGRTGGPEGTPCWRRRRTRPSRCLARGRRGTRRGSYQPPGVQTWPRRVGDGPGEQLGVADVLGQALEWWSRAINSAAAARTQESEHAAAEERAVRRAFLMHRRDRERRADKCGEKARNEEERERVKGSQSRAEEMPVATNEFNRRATSEGTYVRNRCICGPMRLLAFEQF